MTAPLQPFWGCGGAGFYGRKREKKFEKKRIKGVYLLTRK